MNKVIDEMYQGNKRWGNFHSLQEGYAVVEECLQQLRLEMVCYPRAQWDCKKIAKRALKLAAMSFKLLSYLESGIDVTARSQEGLT